MYVIQENTVACYRYYTVIEIGYPYLCCLQEPIETANKISVQLLKLTLLLYV